MNPPRQVAPSPARYARHLSRFNGRAYSRKGKPAVLPSLSGKQIKNPSTRITHKGAKRQKTHSPVKHYLVGFNGYNLSRSDDAQAPQAIKFGYSIFLFFRFVNDFDYNIFRHCPIYYPVIASMPYFILPSLSGKVATSVAQLTEEVKQRNFYIYAYSIKLSYMTSIGTPCHFPR